MSDRALWEGAAMSVSDTLPREQAEGPKGLGWGAFLGTSALCLGVPDVFVYWQKGTGLAPLSHVSFPAFVTSDNACLSFPPLECMGVP